MLHGPSRKTHFSSIPDYDIVITSYALLRLDRIDLERHQFGYVLLDEAQNIKNPYAAVTKAAKGIRALRRLALTGTPTENRPMELLSIIDCLMPGYLGTYEFFKNFIEKPILEVSGIRSRGVRKVVVSANWSMPKLPDASPISCRALIGHGYFL